MHVITVDLMERVHMQVSKTTTKTLGKSKLWKLKVDFKKMRRASVTTKSKIGSHGVDVRMVTVAVKSNENRYLKGAYESLNK